MLQRQLEGNQETQGDHKALLESHAVLREATSQLQEDKLRSEKQFEEEKQQLEQQLAEQAAQLEQLPELSTLLMQQAFAHKVLRKRADMLQSMLVLAAQAAASKLVEGLVVWGLLWWRATTVALRARHSLVASQHDADDSRRQVEHMQTFLQNQEKQTEMIRRLKESEALMANKTQEFFQRYTQPDM